MKISLLLSDGTIVEPVEMLFVAIALVKRHHYVTYVGKAFELVIDVSTNFMKARPYY